MRVDQALETATKKLRDSSDSPRLDAEILLAFVLRRPRLHVLTHSEKKLTTKQLHRFRGLIQQRTKNAPVPYLTGQAEFFGISLHVTPAVLVPRPFTELLVEKLLHHLTSENVHPTIADIGTGSGAIALALAQHLPQAKIIATDTSPTALRLAKKNAFALGLSQRITFLQTSLLTSLTVQPDILVSNLPYLTTRQLREPSIRREPRLALYGGSQGVSLIRKLITQAKAFPSIKVIALEFDPPQLPAIRRYLKQWSPQVKIMAISDGRKVRGLIAQKPTNRV